MSHFITVRTRIRERELLLAALEALELKHQKAADLAVDGDQGSEPVEILVDTGCAAKIGLRRVQPGGIAAPNAEYEVIADWYNVELGCALERDSFLRDLHQRYAYEVVRAQAREQNLVIEEETREDGEIVLILSERA